MTSQSHSSIPHTGGHAWPRERQVDGVVAQVDELRRILDALQRCVAELSATHGNALAHRRLVNDVECVYAGVRRLEIDADELGFGCGPTPVMHRTEMIQIPDTDYDAEFWRGADHEGVGGHNLTTVTKRHKR